MEEQNLKIIKALLKPLNININILSDLDDTEIDREQLLKQEITDTYGSFIDDCKKIYKTSKLTSLHGNRDTKQKFPNINLLRQILRCNDYKLQPVVVSLGYNKSSGMKITKRSYIIKKI